MVCALQTMMNFKYVGAYLFEIDGLGTTQLWLALSLALKNDDETLPGNSQKPQNFSRLCMDGILSKYNQIYDYCLGHCIDYASSLINRDH